MAPALVSKVTYSARGGSPYSAHRHAATPNRALDAPLVGAPTIKVRAPDRGAVVVGPMDERLLVSGAGRS
jgi:hypothetical protein